MVSIGLFYKYKASHRDMPVKKYAHTQIQKLMFTDKDI